MVNISSLLPSVIAWIAWVSSCGSFFLLIRAKIESAIMIIDSVCPLRDDGNSKKIVPNNASNAKLTG